MNFQFAKFFTLLCLLFLSKPALAQDDMDNAMTRIEDLLAEADAAPDASKAAAAARQALKLSSGVRNKVLQVRAHMKFAEASARIDEPDTAVVHYLEAAKLAEGLSDKTLYLAKINESVGDIFLHNHLYANALPYYSAALGLKPNDTGIREKMADTYLLDGKLTLAEQVLTPAIEQFSAAGDLVKVVDIYQKLADASNRIRDPARGVGYYLLIRDIVERIGSPEERARLYNNIGYQQYLAREYDDALRSLQHARSLCLKNKCANPELHLTNLGIVLHNMGDSKTGIQYLLEARDVLVARKEKKTLASLEHIIAKTYFGINDFYNALSHNALSIRYAQESKQHDIWRNAAKTAAELYLELYDHEKAIEFYREYLYLDDSLRQTAQDQQRTLLSRQTLLDRTEKNTQLLLRENTIQELYYDRIRQEKENLSLANKQLELFNRQKQDSLLLLQSQQKITESESQRRIIELLQNEQLLKSQANQRLAEQQLSDLRRQEEIERARQQAKDSIAAHALEVISKEAQISKLELEKQESFRKLANVVGLAGTLILGLLGVSWWLARRARRRLEIQNRRIESQNKLIEAERAKSDSLLRNILPEEIADELKASGEATPRQYEQVTVVFTDFVNFSKLSENLTPEHLINELGECFHAFDLISEKYNLEKIKTIGDAFMCAGGVPIANESNARDAVRAAIEMLEWLDRRSTENPNAVFKNMRIGVHTGPVIAGVIGKNKFAYDIWGDAVNLAARLEEHSEPGRINISRATYQLIRDQFRCSFRGKKEVYNKGKVEMYFVETA